MASGGVIEAVVAKVSDLKNGEMKEVELGEGKVLLVKEHDKIFATGTKCTHYGAPLKTGSLCNGRIRCPWHGACFNVATGDIEDFPGMDSIHTFKVTIKGEDVIVSASESQLKDFKKAPSKGSCSASDQRLFLLVGGGPASAECAETLRAEGFTGKIIVVCKENVLPYDRPKLSKAMSSTADKILLRPAEFYKERNIEFLLGVEVTELDAATKTATLSNGNKLQYH